MIPGNKVSFLFQLDLGIPVIFNYTVPAAVHAAAMKA